MEQRMLRINTRKKNLKSQISNLNPFDKLRVVFDPEAQTRRDAERSRSIKTTIQSSKLEWTKAEEIKKDIENILKVLNLSHIDSSRLFCFRTRGSKSRSYARIWSMPKIFQTALKIKPAYVIEVLSRHFDKLDTDGKKKVLIHELLHIPKNFSGALLPHRSRNRHLGKLTNKLFREYKNNV